MGTLQVGAWHVQLSFEDKINAKEFIQVGLKYILNKNVLI